MTDYKTTCEYLFTRLPAFHDVGAGAYKPGLDTARVLAAAFGDPQDSFRSIHIAGTNGKGSTSHALASVFARAGYRTGLYTSPHIFDFRERIRVNGVPISEEGVIDFTRRYREAALDCEPSFFELATIMAFDWFRRCGVDIAIIETGLGGRLDTTNIITPELSVITNVSLDHTDLLGDTVEKIAAEKAGIIKPGVPVVVGRADGGVRAVIADRAAQCGSRAVFVQDLSWDPVADGCGWIFPRHPGGVPEIHCDLQGAFQRENMATVLTVFDILGFSDDAAVKDGLENVSANTGLMGRWTELRPASPRIICDTGHNIGAWTHLAPMLEAEAAKGPLRVVIGFVSDKDIEPVFRLLPRKAEYYYVAPGNRRARAAADLLELGLANGLHGRVCDSVRQGVKEALADSAGRGTVFIGGSNFVVAELCSCDLP